MSITAYMGKPGQGMSFTLRCVRTAAAARGPACGDTSAAGEARPIPVGNHGDISATGRNV